MPIMANSLASSLSPNHSIYFPPSGAEYLDTVLEALLHAYSAKHAIKKNSNFFILKNF